MSISRLAEDSEISTISATLKISVARGITGITSDVAGLVKDIQCLSAGYIVFDDWEALLAERQEKPMKIVKVGNVFFRRWYRQNFLVCMINSRAIFGSRRIVAVVVSVCLGIKAILKELFFLFIKIAVFIISYIFLFLMSVVGVVFRRFVRCSEVAFSAMFGYNELRTLIL